MRLAGQAKSGFYPAASGAIAGILKHLRPCEKHPEDQYILDPCAGEGLAVKQLAEGLDIPQARTYCVELDAARADAIRANMPEANVLGPASFLGVQITGFSFSVAYVNPPFDDELGGGRREEQSFCQSATRLLAPRGVLVAILPVTALAGNKSFVEFLDSYYEDIKVYRFPEDARPFREVAVIGRKRKIELPRDGLYQHGCLTKMQWQWRYSHDRGMDQEIPVLGELYPAPTAWYNGRLISHDKDPEVATWELARGWRPNTFKKTTYTDDELLSAVAGSPLGRVLDEVADLPVKRPPLPLDKGHVALLLASGMLNGTVEGPEGPHVVRGTAKKVEYYNREASDSHEDPETGKVTTKDVYSQRIVLTIRTVDARGVIRTFSDEPKEDVEAKGADVPAEPQRVAIAASA